jgi:glycosyltransferase involved in cell wall biosynthesis
VRTLLVSHSAQPGGSNQTIIALLRHRPPEIECATIFMQDGPVLAEVRRLGVPARLIDSGRAREAWKAPAVVRAVRREIAETGADVVFGHVTKAHLYASPAARRARLPYLWWQHERLSQKPAMHLLSAWLPADVTICSADFTAAQQRRLHPGAHVRRIHPGAELDPAIVPRRHSAGSGGPIVLGIAGRLQRWKRVELAIESMAQILAAVPHAQLRVIGGVTPGLDEGYDEELRAHARRAGVSEAVTFTGHVDDIGAELAALDVLVHTAEAEPFGLVLVEAMAHAVPVVAVDEGGPREILRDGIDGTLTAASPDAIAHAIIALASDPSRRTAFGAAGRGRAFEQFTAARMAAETWELVAELQRRRA